MESTRATDLVVIGLGYVGLPLVQGAARAGLRVVGLDRSARVVEGLNAGRSHVDDVSDAEVGELLAAGFRATSDASVIADAAAAVICVPTPLTETREPDLSYVVSTAKAIAL